MSRCYAYIVAYISRLEMIGNVVLRPARLEVGHYDRPQAEKGPLLAGSQPQVGFYGGGTGTVQ